MADQIVSYARRQQGSRVGKGQCFDLADTALRGAKAKSAADYGKISPNADYTWGTPVTLAGLQPGDVIQFRNYTYESTVVTKTDKATTTDEVAQDRPHHTAIVESVGEDGAVTVLEQNAPDGSPVTRTVLYFKDSTTTSGKRTTTSSGRVILVSVPKRLRGRTGWRGRLGRICSLPPLPPFLPIRPPPPG
jgi:hypothetical protein